MIVMDSRDVMDGTPDVTASHMVHAAVKFLRVVRLRKSVMLAALVVAVLLGGLYYATATRYYQADASLLILRTGSDVLSPSMGLDGRQQEFMPTYCQLIKSAVVLQGALRHLDPKHRIDFQGQPKEKWVEVLGRNLSATAIRRTNIIEVGYRSKDPEAAAAVVQAVVQAYFEFIDKTHKGTAGEILDVLAREKVQLEQKLSQKEAELLQARGKFGDLGIKPGGHIMHPLVQRAVRLNEALVEAQESRLEYQATLTAVKTAVRSGEDLQQHILAVEAAVGRELLLAGLGFNTRDADVQANLERSVLKDRSELKTLAQYYGPAHPRLTEVAERIHTTEQYLTAYQGKVNQRLNELKDNQLGPMLVQMLSQALAKAWQQEKSLHDSFEQARLDAVRLNGDLAKLEILDHDVKRLRGFHDVLVNQIANTDLQQEHGDIRATVVKEPSPRSRPVSPRISLVLIACAMGGLTVGGATIYVLDILDDRFRSPEELRIRLGVPMLAMVRQMEVSEDGGLAGVQANRMPDAVESEAFRTLRTALAFSPHETERIVVSSSEPGDGKTTVLVNLAVSYAQIGKKILLIDADLRRPGLTSLLHMKGDQGVSDVLRCQNGVDELVSQCVQRTDIAGLDILASGPRRPNPSELLAGPNFADLLAWADAHYDQVLVDSPPVLAASDAQILGRMVDGVILVVHTQKNRRRVVARAVESFAGLGVQVLGVVANRINPDDRDGYGYGYGYGYTYGESDNAPLPPLDAAGSVVSPQLAGNDPWDTTDPVPDRDHDPSSSVAPRRVA